MRSFIRWRSIVAMLLCFQAVVTWAAERAGDVNEARATANRNGDNWLVKGGGFYQDQFSPLKEVNDKNVDKLGFAWQTDLDDPMGLVSEPIVVDGTIYLSGPRSLVYAIDGVSGKLLWRFDPHVRLGISAPASLHARVNRGVAIWNGKVYVATGDCRLIAIDAPTGSLIWDRQICDPKETGITAAPRVARGKIFVGYEAESGVHGSIAAFDAQTGKELWRFWTVPGDPAKGFDNATMAMAAKTWTGDKWWLRGGAGVWTAITYDPVTGLLLFGTSKSLGPSVSGYKYLFTCSIVAVEADTGKYVWSYQTRTAHQQEENFQIALADMVIRGRKRHVAMTTDRTGTFFLLNATTGERISSRPLVPQSGDPNELPGVRRMPYPGLLPGGVEDCKPRRCFGVRNWWPMSYNPVTHLVYVPIFDLRRGTIKAGELPMVGRLLAWDPATESQRWSVEHPIIVNSGVLSTAGNLVFQGQGTGEFDAFDAESGRKLWSVQTGSAIDAVPVTYRVHGQQYIIVPVGWGAMFRLFAPSRMSATPTSKYGPSRLLAFRLGSKTPFPTVHVHIPEVPKPPDQTDSAEAVQRGKQAYIGFECEGCHSFEVDGSGRWVMNGGIPDLRYLPPQAHQEWYAIVLGGSHRAQGMMPFGIPQDGLPALTAAQADDIHAYVIDRARAAYNAQQKTERSH